MSREKISIITLGCAKNTVDSERLMKQLSLNEFELVNDAEAADTVIINTCGFIEAAREESVNTILEAVQLKNSGKLKKVFVAGCLSERYSKELEKEIPEVDKFFGTENYEQILNSLGGSLKYELLGERILSTPSHTAYLKISEGCDNPCSFCSIPLMRGLHKSKTIDELVKETEFLAANNTKELIIIAQDTTDYGKDIYGERKIAELISRLSKVNGIEWIRLMYAYPSHFPDELIEEFNNNPKLLKYLDIPLQHISDNVLKSMRRGISKRRTIELLETLREKIPGIILRTTMIVGYPAETANDFNELLDFVNEFKFDRLGVFTFSVEESVSSFILGDPVSQKEKERRKKILMEAQQKISLQKNEMMIGKRLKVLVEALEGDYYIARSENDAPEVDGEILIPKNSSELVVGNFYFVVVNDCNEYDLFAQLELEVKTA